MSDENEAKPDQKRRRPSKKSDHKGEQKSFTPEEEVLQDFAACPRCSYFWAGYKVIVGDEGIQTAVSQQKEGWLTLVWSHPMRDLVHKSYGVRMDADFFHYEGCCVECTRPFVFQSNGEDGSACFLVELTPWENE